MNKKLWIVLLITLISTTAYAQANMSDSTTVKIGYSRENMNTVAGAIGQVTESRMNKGLITSSLDALSGQAAGVQVTQGDNQEAMVSAVRVRGTTSLTGKNDPLVIIDGVMSDLSTLGSLYPGDIDSFTILKDASETAQYGSRGASGVIKVSTRRSRGGEFSISYDATGGVEAVSDYLGGKEKALQALFGLCMKDLHGKGDPSSIREFLTQEVEKLR